VDCGLQDARFHVNSRVFSEVQKKKWKLLEDD
jgi:hypothetical protein